MTGLRGVLVLAGLPLLVLTGCGTAGSGVVSAATPSASYDVRLAPSPTPSSREAIVGAAGRIVHCAGPIAGGSSTAPFDGEDTGATPEAALQAAREWVRWDGVQDGYALARVEGSRRLYVFEVGGVAKQALIVRHGPALKGDGTRATVTRWWLESWARCDYSELPEAIARRQGLEIWSDAEGDPQLTSTILSFRFGAGCYSGMTALDLGGPMQGGTSTEKRRPVEYVRNPDPALQQEYFDRDFVEHTAVPEDAIDSGYQREGDHLWFSSDRAVAYVGTAHDAAAWPRARQPIRCA